jgi:hypothetical protein
MFLPLRCGHDLVLVLLATLRAIESADGGIEEFVESRPSVVPRN